MLTMLQCTVVHKSNQRLHLSHSFSPPYTASPPKTIWTQGCVPQLSGLHYCTDAALTSHDCPYSELSGKQLAWLAWCSFLLCAVDHWHSLLAQWVSGRHQQCPTQTVIHLHDTTCRLRRLFGLLAASAFYSNETLLSFPHIMPATYSEAEFETETSLPISSHACFGWHVRDGGVSTRVMSMTLLSIFISCFRIMHRQ